MEKWKENKIKRNAKYNKDNYTGFLVRVRKGSDLEKWILSQENKNKYLLELIENDMEKSTKK